MTPRRAEVLDLIRSHLHTEGNSPSLCEIAAKLGVHKSTALRHLRALELEGLIRRPKGVHRGVSVVDAPPRDDGVEPELVQALFQVSWEVEKGLASMDLDRIRRAVIAARTVADAWMNGELSPQPPVADEGCTEVAPPSPNQAAGPGPIPV